MKSKGRNRAILLGVVSILFFAGFVCAETFDKYQLPKEFSWYGESEALRAPTYDASMPGLWWMPDNALAGQENIQWGNRGYVFVGLQEVAPTPKPAVVAAPKEKLVYVDRPVEKIVYRDRIVEKPVEKLVYVNKPVEKIVYRDRIVEKPVEKIVYVDRFVDKVQTVKLMDIFFNFDSSKLTQLGESKLTENLEVLKANPKVNVLLIGSASPEGASTYNQNLSHRRVNTVSTWLLNNGIPQSSFITKAIGEIPAEKGNYPFARKVQINVTDMSRTAGAK